MAYVVGDYITAAGLNSLNANKKVSMSGDKFWRVYGVTHTLTKKLGYAYSHHSNAWLGNVRAYIDYNINPLMDPGSIVAYMMDHSRELYSHYNWPFGPSWSTTVDLYPPNSSTKYLTVVIGSQTFGKGSGELLLGQIDCVQGSEFEYLSYDYDSNFRPIKLTGGSKLHASMINNCSVGTYGHA